MMLKLSLLFINIIDIIFTNLQINSRDRRR